MMKKTGEELRARAALRAKRWREKYRWKHLERVKEVYGRSNAQKHSEDGVTPGELERYAKREGGEKPVEVREVQETHTETDDEAWERERGNKQAPRVVAVREPLKEEVVVEAGTIAERRVRFESLKAKLQRGDDGEEVEM